MASTIDPTRPLDGAPASKADLRSNLSAAREELNHGGFFPPISAGAIERTVAARLNDVVSVKDFGATGEGMGRVDDVTATLGSATITSASNPWTEGDVGKKIAIYGATSDGATNHILETTIASFVSAGEITLDTYATQSASNANTLWWFDESAVIQAAIDHVRDNGGGCLDFPAGVYVCRMVQLRPGVYMRGNGSTILRTPAGAIVDETSMRFWRVFKHESGTGVHEDSGPIWIDGFIFDGNRENANWTEGTFNQENGALIYLNCVTAGNTARLRAFISNCTFQHDVSDGIAIFLNMEVQINNIIIRDVFRGGLVLHGGNSFVNVSNFTIDHSGIDVETLEDATLTGDQSVQMNMSNGFIAGDFDVITAWGTNNIINLHNIIMKRPWANWFVNGELHLTNCHIHIMGGDGVVENHLVDPRHVVIRDCVFVVDEDLNAVNIGGTPLSEADRTLAAIAIRWDLGNIGITNQFVLIEGCRFKIGTGIDATDTVRAIWSRPILANNTTARLVIRNCLIESGFDQGIYIEQGGIVDIDGVVNDAVTPYWFGAATDRGLDLTMGPRVYTGPSNTSWVHWGAQSTTLMKIRFRDVVVEHENNIISAQFGSTNLYSGRRIVMADTDPGSATNNGGFVGDIWRLRTPVAGSTFEWVCTASSTTNATWKALTQVAA